MAVVVLALRRARRLARWLGCAAAIGCSGPGGAGGDAGPDPGDAGGEDGPAECESRAGSRIHLDGFRAADGTFEPLALRDVGLDIDCHFAERDGIPRCVPAVRGEVRYLDAGCTQPVLLVGPGRTPPSHHEVVRASGDACAPDRELRPVGDELADVVAVYVAGDPGVCLETSPGGDRVFSLGPVLPWGELVGASVAADGDGRLRVRRFDGDDGSVFCDRSGALEDTTAGVPCQLDFDVDDALRCLPVAPTAVPRLVDETCANTGPVVPLASCSAGPPAFVRQLEAPGACRRSVQVFEVGDPVTVYTHVLDACAAVGDVYHAVGAEREAGAWAGVTLAWTGRGRLQRGLWVSDDGYGVFRGDWRDAKLEAACEPARAVDGVSRCLPIGASTGTYFLDAECSNAAVLARQDTGACDGGEPGHARALQSVDDAGVSRYRVFAVGAEVLGQVFQDSGGCVPVPAADARFFELGAELAPSSFAELAWGTEG